jgi:hypothetical protein
MLLNLSCSCARGIQDASHMHSALWCGGPEVFTIYGMHLIKSETMRAEQAGLSLVHVEVSRTPSV